MTRIPPSRSPGRSRRTGDALSARETQIVAMYAGHKTCKEIGEAFGYKCPSRAISRILARPRVQKALEKRAAEVAKRSGLSMERLAAEINAMLDRPVPRRDPNHMERLKAIETGVRILRPDIEQSKVPQVNLYFGESASPMTIVALPPDDELIPDV